MESEIVNIFSAVSIPIMETLIEYRPLFISGILKMPSVLETTNWRFVESDVSTSFTVAPGSGLPSLSRTVPVITVPYRPAASEDEMSNVRIVFFIMKSLM